MYGIERLIAAIAPHRCLVCGAEPLPLCRPCTDMLPFTPKCCYKCAKTAPGGLCTACQKQSQLCSIVVRTGYGGTAEQLIHQLKFGRAKAVADCIALAMVPCCPSGLITHVPTATKRIRQRGYDQAALIAKQLALHTDQGYLPLLGRAGTQRQLGQDRQTRQRQLLNAYYPLRTTKTVPKDTPIILLDDVLTTGATLEAAAITLRKAGYTNLHALAFAWVPHQSQPG